MSDETIEHHRAVKQRIYVDAMAHATWAVAVSLGSKVKDEHGIAFELFRQLTHGLYECAYGHGFDDGAEDQAELDRREAATAARPASAARSGGSPPAGGDQAARTKR